MAKRYLFGSTVCAVQIVSLYQAYHLSIATSDLLHQAQFALDVKAKVLPLYEKIFDVEYPLPKLDTLVVW